MHVSCLHIPMQSHIHKIFGFVYIEFLNQIIKGGYALSYCIHTFVSLFFFFFFFVYIVIITNNDVYTYKHSEVSTAHSMAPDTCSWLNNNNSICLFVICERKSNNNKVFFLMQNSCLFVHFLFQTCIFNKFQAVFVEYR